MNNRCSRRGAALVVVGFALGLAGGCQSAEKVKADGSGRAHTSQAVDAYAARYGVSRQQARQELNRIAGAADEQKAVDDLQEAGVRMR